jgi:hypothetical protein
MASATGRPDSRTLAEWIQIHTLRSVSGKSFVLTEQLKAWLASKPNGPDAQNLLGSLFDAVRIHRGSEIKTAPSVPENFALVFCILLEHRLEDYLDGLTSHGITNNSLPVSISDLRDLATDLGISETKLTVDFYEMQWRFRPAVFELDMDEEWPPEMIVPICSQVLIAEGRTARVYEVSIPEEFIGKRLRQVMSAARREDSQDPARWVSLRCSCSLKLVNELSINQSYRFALKAFDDLHAKFGKREMAAFRVLQNHENLLRPLAAFSTTGNRDPEGSPVSRTAYSILLEYGDVDLSEYFTTANPPTTFSEIQEFWKSLCGVVEAVAQLHRRYENVTAEKCIGMEITGWAVPIAPSICSLLTGI